MIPLTEVSFSLLQILQNLLLDTPKNNKDRTRPVGRALVGLAPSSSSCRPLEYFSFKFNKKIIHCHFIFKSSGIVLDRFLIIRKFKVDP